jgi:hypothetical protein
MYSPQRAAIDLTNIAFLYLLDNKTDQVEKYFAGKRIEFLLSAN